MVDCDGIDVVGRGLWWHDGSGVEFGGFAWCFPWCLYDVVVVGYVVDSGWWLLVVLLMVGGGCVVDDGLVGGDWKFWVDRWVALFLMVG